MPMKARICTSLVLVIFATAALADEIPPRKPGGWELVTKGEKIDDVKMKLCLDKATDKLFHDLGTDLVQKSCSRRDVKVVDNVATIDSECKVAGSKVTGVTVMKFDGDTAYHAEIKDHFEPPLLGKTDVATTQDGKWIGPCTDGMKPGDFSVGDGIKVNIKMLDTIRQFFK